MAESNLAEVLGASPARVDDAVAVLMAVADPIRWTVLQRLVKGTACVCTLAELTPVAANLLSYHLKVLREAGLVTTARRGRWIDYSLADDAALRLASALPTANLTAHRLVP